MVEAAMDVTQETYIGGGCRAAGRKQWMMLTPQCHAMSLLLCFADSALILRAHSWCRLPSSI